MFMNGPKMRPWSPLGLVAVAALLLASIPALAQPDTEASAPAAKKVPHKRHRQAPSHNHPATMRKSAGEAAKRNHPAAQQSMSVPAAPPPPVNHPGV